MNQHTGKKERPATFCIFDQSDETILKNFRRVGGEPTHRFEGEIHFFGFSLSSLLFFFVINVVAKNILQEQLPLSLTCLQSKERQSLPRTTSPRARASQNCAQLHMERSGWSVGARQVQFHLRHAALL